MSREAASRDNVVQLPRPERSAEATAAAAKRVRLQLSLLQGYADLMFGLSPEQHIQIMRVMADKVRELTEALQPFLDSARTSKGQPPDRNRRARSQTRRLTSDYRHLRRRLQGNLTETRFRAERFRGPIEKS